MNPHLLALTLGPLLLAGATSSGVSPEPEDAGQEVEVRYRPLGNGREQMSLTARYGSSRRIDVGWRLALRRHATGDPIMAGRLVTMGPLWTYVARRKGKSAALRVEVNPWFGVHSTLTAPPTNPDDPLATRRVIRMRMGADASAMLHGTLRLGPAWCLAPGVGATATIARATNLADTDATKPWLWDRQTGWRVALPMWLGARQRFKLEAGYVRPGHEGQFLQLVHERWDLALAWTF